MNKIDTEAALKLLVRLTSRHVNELYRNKLERSRHWAEVIKAGHDAEIELTKVLQATFERLLGEAK
jgi:hypothetical protein